MRVISLASIPRDMGFNLHWYCQREHFAPLRIEVREYGGAFWHQALERLIEGAITDGYTHALTMDFDTIFERLHVETLLDLARRNPDADAIVPWQIKRDSTDRIFGKRREDGTFRRHFDESEFTPELMPIDTGHFGLTVLRLDALKALPRPLFQPVPDASGGWDGGHVDADIYFWNQARKYGLQLFLATKVRVGHLQQVVTWPTTDFGIEHQFVEAFRHNGTPESAR
jgi:hypothetical protein